MPSWKTNADLRYLVEYGTPDELAGVREELRLEIVAATLAGKTGRWAAAGAEMTRVAVCRNDASAVGRWGELFASLDAEAFCRSIRHGLLSYGSHDAARAALPYVRGDPLTELVVLTRLDDGDAIRARHAVHRWQDVRCDARDVVRDAWAFGHTKALLALRAIGFSLGCTADRPLECVAALHEDGVPMHELFGDLSYGMDSEVWRWMFASNRVSPERLAHLLRCGCLDCPTSKSELLAQLLTSWFDACCFDDRYIAAEILLNAGADRMWTGTDGNLRGCLAAARSGDADGKKRFDRLLERHGCPPPANSAISRHAIVVNQA